MPESTPYRGKSPRYRLGVRYWLFCGLGVLTLLVTVGTACLFLAHLIGKPVPTQLLGVGLPLSALLSLACIALIDRIHP